MKRILVFSIIVSSVLALSAAEPIAWRNLDEEHHLGGRMTSAGYQRGKVVLVDCRDYGKKSCVASARELQSIWATYKMKPFVLIGSHRGEAGKEKIERISKGLGLTYPIYSDAGLTDNEPTSDKDGFMYIVSSTGKVLYRGNDMHRVGGVIASAILALRAPTTPKQWSFLLDFDIDVLPGQALNELKEFRSQFPEEAKKYDAAWERLSSDEEIKKVAKLEQLARQAKDYDKADANAKRLSADKLAQVIEKFSSLKESSNSAVSQEAKNCLADLTIAAAALNTKPKGEK